MGEKWGFFLLFDAIIAHRCATMRYDSASPKTGAWPSLIQIVMEVNHHIQKELFDKYDFADSADDKPKEEKH